MADEIIKEATSPLLAPGTLSALSGGTPIEVPSSEPTVPPPNENISQHIAGVGGWIWKPELGKHEWERANSPIPDIPKSGLSVMVEDVGGWMWSPEKQMHQWEQWGMQQPTEQMRAVQQPTEQMKAKQSMTDRGETPIDAGYEWDEERKGWVRSSDKLLFIPKDNKPAWEKYIPKISGASSVSPMSKPKRVRRWDAKNWWDEPYYSNVNGTVKITKRQQPIGWHGLLPPQLDGEI